MLQPLRKLKLFKNAPAGWRIKSTKPAYSNDLFKVFEDTLRRRRQNLR